MSRIDSPYLAGSVTEAPVGLVLTEAGGRSNAMTVSFFSEVAHYPTALWVSIAKNSFTHELLEASGRFSLIVLHRKQVELARLCGTASGRNQNKCASLPVYRSKENFLFLEHALTSTACEVESRTDVGDHTLFIGKILFGDVDSAASIHRHLLTVDLL